MSRDLNRKTSLSSAAAVIAVGVTVVAWPLASQAEHGHGGRTGGSAGFSAAPSVGGHTRSGSAHFSGNPSAGFRASDGNHRHFRHRRNGVAFGFYGDDYGYGYTSSCEYYRQRALDTGRGYWWRRYRACLDD